jgi:hypothetical protein
MVDNPFLIKHFQVDDFFIPPESNRLVVTSFFAAPVPEGERAFGWPPYYDALACEILGYLRSDYWLRQESAFSPSPETSFPLVRQDIYETNLVIERGRMGLQERPRPLLISPCLEQAVMADAPTKTVAARIQVNWLVPGQHVQRREGVYLLRMEKEGDLERVHGILVAYQELEGSDSFGTEFGLQQLYAGQFAYCVWDFQGRCLARVAMQVDKVFSGKQEYRFEENAPRVWRIAQEEK